MTKDNGIGGKDQGILFLGFPDGSGMTFSLIGEASEPEPEPWEPTSPGNWKDGLWTIKAKEVYVEKLKIKNWLKQKQRFKVLIERTKCDNSTKIEVLI